MAVKILGRAQFEVGLGIGRTQMHIHFRDCDASLSTPSIDGWDISFH